MKQHIVSFSGGKDSTAMLLMMLERGMRVDRVICVDTTKEFPQMYEHIAKVQEIIQPLQIEIVKIDFDYWFGEHVISRGERKGVKGYGWPGMGFRWCTSIKVAAIERELRAAGNIIQYLGIAADEKHREGKNKRKHPLRYPLIEWQITEAQALQYCYDRGLDWGGLYEKFARVSCYCCPLARLGELKTIHGNYPELWQEMQEMDKRSFRRFKPTHTLQELEDRFKQENKQMELGL